MTRVRTDNVFGTITDNPLTSGATTMNSAGLANLAAVSSAEAIIILDPNRLNGAPEIVVVTAHTGGATSAPIQRGQFGTSARQHPQGTQWVHGPIAGNATTYVTAADDQGDYVPMNAWESWTPTLGQGATSNIAKTVDYARYVRIGRTIFANFYLTVTGTGTAAASVHISLPVALNATQGAVPAMIGGGLTVFDSSANTYYMGLVDNAATTTDAYAKPLTSIGLGSQYLGIGSNAGTALFAAALANGDYVTGSLFYEAAS